MFTEETAAKAAEFKTMLKCNVIVCYEVRKDVA